MSALDRLISGGMSDILAANVAATERLAAAIDRLAAAQETANEMAGAA